MILNGKQLLEYSSADPPHFEKMILVGTYQQNRSLNIQQKDASGGTDIPLTAKTDQNLRITADSGLF